MSDTSEETLIFITGATEGIGEAIARLVPYENARIINFSRRKHPTLETVQIDLTKPETWDLVRQTLKKELAAFKGKRALFFISGYYSHVVGLIGKAPSESYEAGVLANVAAPLVLAEAFISAAGKPDYEAGVILMSSGAAVAPIVGMATYCAAKTSMEHWAEVAMREREATGGKGPWVVAVRPGGVETEPVRRASQMDPEIFPRAKRINANIVNRLQPDGAAKHIWSVLPPEPGVSVITFAPEIDHPDFSFGGPRTKTVDVPGWRLLYQ